MFAASVNHPADLKTISSIQCNMAEILEKQRTGKVVNVLLKNSFKYSFWMGREALQVLNRERRDHLELKEFWFQPPCGTKELHKCSNVCMA